MCVPHWMSLSLYAQSRREQMMCAHHYPSERMQQSTLCVRLSMRHGSMLCSAEDRDE